MPVLTAATRRSPKTASACARIRSRSSSVAAVTPRVFCAVIAVMTEAPYPPLAEMAFRSAWMPAPAEESEPAMVRTIGIMCAPYAGITRVRFDGYVLRLGRADRTTPEYRLR